MSHLEGQGGRGIYLPALGQSLGLSVAARRCSFPSPFQPARPGGRTALCSLRGSPSQEIQTQAVASWPAHGKAVRSQGYGQGTDSVCHKDCDHPVQWALPIINVPLDWRMKVLVTCYVAGAKLDPKYQGSNILGAKQQDENIDFKSLTTHTGSYPNPVKFLEDRDPGICHSGTLSGLGTSRHSPLSPSSQCGP